MLTELARHTDQAQDPFVSCSVGRQESPAELATSAVQVESSGEVIWFLHQPEIP